MAAEVSGVNVVYSLIYIVFQFAFGCSSGFSVITSNCAGEKRPKNSFLLLQRGQDDF